MKYLSSSKRYVDALSCCNSNKLNLLWMKSSKKLRYLLTSADIRIFCPFSEPWSGLSIILLLSIASLSSIWIIIGDVCRKKTNFCSLENFAPGFTTGLIHLCSNKLQMYSIVCWSKKCMNSKAWFWMNCQSSFRSEYLLISCRESTFNLASSHLLRSWASGSSPDLRLESMTLICGCSRLWSAGAAWLFAYSTSFCCWVATCFKRSLLMVVFKVAFLPAVSSSIWFWILSMISIKTFCCVSISWLDTCSLSMASYCYWSFSSTLLNIVLCMSTTRLCDD